MFNSVQCRSNVMLSSVTSCYVFHFSREYIATVKSNLIIVQMVWKAMQSRWNRLQCNAMPHSASQWNDIASHCSGVPLQLVLHCSLLRGCAQQNFCYIYTKLYIVYIIASAALRATPHIVTLHIAGLCSPTTTCTT